MRAFLLIVLFFSGAASLQAAEKAAIDAAIKKAGDYLRGVYGKGIPMVGHGLGEHALAGLALLEASTDKGDPAVKNVTELVRNTCLDDGKTYDTALSIIYLDRHGDPRDIPLIQMLGIRLNAGMNAAGGWGYNCWNDTANGAAILKSLQTASLTNTKSEKDKKKDDGFIKTDDTAKPIVSTAKLHSEVAKVATAVQNAIRTSGRSAGQGDDNSNTQFGIVGLWVAARNGVPCKEAFSLIEARFLRTQSSVDGGWGYMPGGNGGQQMTTQSTVAMTCAGLLGLAVGKASRNQLKPASTTNKSKDQPEGAEDDPFLNPKKDNGDKADPAAKQSKENLAANGKAAEFALKTLAAAFTAGVRGGGNNQQGPFSQFTGLGTIMYTLWSVERVRVAYSLDTLGGADWHSAGADVIISMQAADGSVSDTQYGAVVNTSLAVLFLAKANYTRDLGTKAKDPGKAELRGGGGAGIPPPLMAPGNAKGNKAAENEEAKTKPGFTLPTIAQPTQEGETEKVAMGLTTASETEWKTKLDEAVAGRGDKWTRGLTLAAARLDGERRFQARDALAERLTRMTQKTLRDMLKDPEAELRRAACLAAAMKEDSEMIPDLISKLADPNEFVMRAARAGLKSFGQIGTDFGPKNGADDDAKTKAAEAWAAWYEKTFKKK
jgi:hypothetical protein